MKCFSAVLILLILFASVCSAESNLITALKSKAEDGDVQSQKNLGVIYEQGMAGVNPNDNEAIKWYLKAAESGDPTSQVKIAKIYRMGVVRSQDTAESLKFYRLAASQGNAEAQYNLGMMSEAGEGMQRDASEAVKWYKKAAEQGHAAAQYNLGKAYIQGKGLEVNYATAYVWMSLAFRGSPNTVPEARFSRDQVQKKLTREQLAEAKKIVDDWKPLTVSQIPETSVGPASYLIAPK
jgi:uncharacterized protein